jgi:glycine oxidase
LADTAGERASMMGMTGYWDELNIGCDRVSSDEVARREPAIAAWIDGDDRDRKAAWWLADEHQIRPPHYLQALHQACLVGGVRFIEGGSVRDLEQTDHHATVITDDGTRHDADAVVVCGGVWTGAVADRLQLRQSLIPIRGQILLLKTTAPLLKSVVNVGHRYVMCRDDGSTLVGSCEEEVGFQLGTDEQTLAELNDFAAELVPELRHAERVTSWSGLRPLTFDGFPMIGRVPSMASVYVASGHFRSGFHLSPGTAVTMAQLILNETPTINLDAFRVGKQQQHAAN